MDLPKWKSRYSPGPFKTGDGKIRIYPSPFGPRDKEEVAEIWNAYAIVLRKEGISELLTIRDYLENERSGYEESVAAASERVEEFDENQLGMELDTPGEEFGVRSSLVREKEELAAIQDELKFRLVVLENIIWRYVTRRESFTYAELLDTGEGLPVIRLIPWLGEESELHRLHTLLKGPHDRDPFIVTCLQPEDFTAHFNLEDEAATGAIPKKIKWCRYQTDLIYLFIELKDKNFLPAHFWDDGGHKCLSEHFIKRNGEPLDSNNLRKSKSNLDPKSKNGDAIDRIVEEVTSMDD